MVNKNKEIINILLVDDHPVLRKGLKDLIEEEKDLVVSAEAGDCNEAINILANNKIDVAVLDLTLEGEMSGLDLARSIRERFPKVKSLILSMHDESLFAERSIKAGARGYIMKKEATTNIVGAIRKVMNGELYLSERISGKIIDKLLHGHSDDSSGSPLDSLANREFEVFQMIGNGLSSSEISKKMNISVNTVDSHRRNIKEKLGLTSAAELVKHAVQWNLTKDQN